MTGPLAQQFAQVRYVLNLMAVREACSDLEVLPQHLASLDAVDEIERHVQDTTSALERFVDAWFEGPDYDEPLNAAAGEAMTVLGTTFALTDKPGVDKQADSDKPQLAALSAREKEEE